MIWEEDGPKIAHHLSIKIERKNMSKNCIQKDQKNSMQKEKKLCAKRKKKLCPLEASFDKNVTRLGIEYQVHLCPVGLNPGWNTPEIGKNQWTTSVKDGRWFANEY